MSLAARRLSKYRFRRTSLRRRSRAGYQFGYAVGSDGHVYAWGANSAGQLGDGTATGPEVCTEPSPLPPEGCSSMPVQVSLPSGVTATAVAAGNQSGYAIGSDGNVYAWGSNTFGDLGDGTTTNSDIAVRVSLPTGVTATAIASGFASVYAIGSDRKLYAWGYNASGELGDGTTTGPDFCDGLPCSTTPVETSLPTGVSATAVTAAEGTGYAGGSDGKLYAWGYNGDGELGDGTTTESDIPAQVSLPTGVTATTIGAGSEDGYAIGSDGNVYSWGSNTYGELGDDTTTGPDICNGFLCSTTPVRVSLPSGSTPLTLSSGATSGATAGSAFVTVAIEPHPTTSVLVPTSGATLSGLTYIDASASNATSVKFLLFGGVYGYGAPVICTARLTYYGWLCSWNSTTVPNGYYTLTSLASNSGGYAFSPGVDINVDN